MYLPFDIFRALKSEAGFYKIPLKLLLMLLAFKKTILLYYFNFVFNRKCLNDTKVGKNKRKTCLVHSTKLSLRK